MFCFAVELFAVSASFRLPEAHTFQQTLPLPPLTTLIGMAGAASGLDFPAAMALREQGLRVGVLGQHGGEARDLWKYQKIKAGEVISAVLTREILTDLELRLLYAFPRRPEAEALRQAFASPVYALTAGTSDDLVKIRRVSPVTASEPEPLGQLEQTLLPGDHSQNFASSIAPNRIPIHQTLRPPQVFLLPTAFSFSGQERRISERKPFTFVDTPIQLKKPVIGIPWEGRSYPLL